MDGKSGGYTKLYGKSVLVAPASFASQVGKLVSEQLNHSQQGRRRCVCTASAGMSSYLSGHVGRIRTVPGRQLELEKEKTPSSSVVDRFEKINKCKLCQRFMLHPSRMVNITRIDSFRDADRHRSKHLVRRRPISDRVCLSRHSNRRQLIGQSRKKNTFLD